MRVKNIFNFWKKPRLDETIAVKKFQGFGTFYGVYLPGILAVFGVIIYLRMGWIVGAVGLPKVLLIITTAFTIVGLTSLSIASVATNMRVGSGGTYYIVSRSFGVEIGSAIGLALYVAGALNIAFCTIGFAESLHTVLPMFPIQTISLATLVVLAALVYVSSDAALKAQFVIFLFIGVSLVSLFLGRYVPTVETAEITPPLIDHKFWAVFAIFFPAAKGIETGVALSGDLKNPKRSLPIGTLAIVVSAYFVYMAIAYFLAKTVPRSVLVNDPLIVLKIAKYKPFILVGIWSATLSSAIGGLLGSPRMLQAIAKDGVLPKFLSKGSGPANEPRIASLITFVIAIFIVYYGSIDLIAPYLTMFGLVAYCMLNLGAGMESFLANPSWRPSFEVPAIFPLTGAALCLIAMLIIDSGGALIAMMLIFITYAYIKKRTKGRNWDDIRTALLQYMCRFSVYKLLNAPRSPKSWRPNFLVFSRSPTKSTGVFEVASAITRGRGFLTLASFMPEKEEGKSLSDWQSLASKFLQNQNTPAIVKINARENPHTQISELIRCYGLGPLSPNTVVMGIPENRQLTEDFIETLKIIRSNKRNFLLVSSNDAELDPKKINHIDLWWENDQRKSSELMLLLSLLLSRHPKWKKHQMHLKSIVSTEDARGQREGHFQEFLTATRLPFDSNVLVIPERTDHIPAFGRFSKDSHVVFITLPDNLDSEELKQRLELAKTFPLAIFVSCGEETEFKQIFD